MSSGDFTSKTGGLRYLATLRLFKGVGHALTWSWTPSTRVDILLKSTARELQSWSQRSVGQIKTQLLVAKTIVLWLDRAQEVRPLTQEEAQLRRELKCKVLGLSSLERTMAQLHSRITYLRSNRLVASEENGAEQSKEKRNELCIHVNFLENLEGKE